jgi:FkbM family methyltransferase
MSTRLLRAGKDSVKAFVRRFGYDILPYPTLGSLPAHLRALFHARRITCVLDVGAHRGEYGRLLRDAGYRGDIVSFEPVMAQYQRLSVARGRDRRWHTHNLALGSERGSAEITVTSNSLLSSFLTLNEFGREAFNYGVLHDRVETVRVERLDDIFDTVTGGMRNQGVHLKLDTQGWDLEVIKGASKCLPRIQTLQLELSIKPIYAGMPDFFQSITMLNRLGFATTGLFPVSSTSKLHLVEVDCVMAR